MKRKAGISLTVALLMVVSTFAVGAFNVSTNETYPFGDIVKEVFDGEDWVDSVEAEIGDTLRFRINITYHETDHEDAEYAYNITITDTLPDCLEYANNATPEETDVSGKVITWDLGDTQLYEGDFVVIEFNATVIDYTDGDGEANIAEIYANETCSGYDLYDTASAIVIVEEELCVPGIEVIKKVKNAQGEWDEYLGDLLLGDFVDFKIEVIYNECDLEYTLLNAIIKDELPCCLEFNETLDISSTGPFMDMPTEEVTNNNKTVYWNWTQDESFIIEDGDILTIEFRAEFVNYCEGANDNWVCITMWGCTPPGQEPLIFEGADNATVDCDAPDIEFNKLVWNDHTKHWVEEIETNQDAILRFGLGLTYYGDGYIYDIKFKDVLPCILEYRNNAWLYSSVQEDTPIEATNISDDGKIIYFNLTEMGISDGDYVSIFFDVLVNGTTGNECCECEFVENWGYVTFDKCEEEPTTMSDNVTIRSGCNSAPSIPIISGPHTAQLGVATSFSFVSTDQNNDQIYIKYSATRAVNDESWHGPYDSGEKITIDIAFTSTGTAYITAIAKDIHGAESGWTPEGFGYKVVVTTEDEEEPELDVTLKLFSLGKICAKIANVGEVDLSDIAWNITAEGGLLGNFQATGNCTIEELEEDHTATVCTGIGSVKRGFGRVNVTVTITLPGEDPVEYGFKGFVLGRIFIRTGIEAQE